MTPRVLVGALARNRWPPDHGGRLRRAPDRPRIPSRSGSETADSRAPRMDAGSGQESPRACVEEWRNAKSSFQASSIEKLLPSPPRSAGLRYPIRRSDHRGFVRLRPAPIARHTAKLPLPPGHGGLTSVSAGSSSTNFNVFVLGITQRVKDAAYASAKSQGRPVHYLTNNEISKEALARKIAREDGVNSGLIAIFGAVENCRSYSVRGNRQTQKLHLVLERRKMPPSVPLFSARGLGSVSHARSDLVPLHGGRLSQRPRVAGPPDGRRPGWLPSARQLLQSVGWRIRPHAQALLDEQLRTSWARQLGGVCSNWPIRCTGDV